MWLSLSLTPTKKKNKQTEKSANTLFMSKNGQTVNISKLVLKTRQHIFLPRFLTATAIYLSENSLKFRLVSIECLRCVYIAVSFSGLHVSILVHTNGLLMMKSKKNGFYRLIMIRKTAFHAA